MHNRDINKLLEYNLSYPSSIQINYGNLGIYAIRYWQFPDLNISPASSQILDLDTYEFHSPLIDRTQVLNSNRRN
jgi:hypothetical protein